jgi:hypothetical protein
VATDGVWRAGGGDFRTALREWLSLFLFILLFYFFILLFCGDRDQTQGLATIFIFKGIS